MSSRNPGRVKLAREFRQADVPAEKRLWKELRAAQATFKFRRQHPVGPYFADFACCECRVIVELDGERHVGRELKDESRTQFLQSAGWTVLRFWNTDVYDHLGVVLEMIHSACEARRRKPP